MITAIRDVRRARGMTLADVAAACVPATTAQTIGRLEMGTRTVSVDWLNRIAAALGVTAADLVTLPTRAALPVVAVLEAGGVHAPRRSAVVTPPEPGAGMTAIVVANGVGDYRSGDAIWCDTLAPADYGRAMHRDVLVPRPAGRFVFGRLMGLEGEGDAMQLQLLSPGHGSRPQSVPAPAWIARAVRLVRDL